MVQNLRHWSWSLAIALNTLIGLNVNTKVVANEIVPDNSLGSESSVVIPNANINGTFRDLIEGGATRGSNLFHSFLEFNIDAGQGAYFANPAAIENIFSRVTGTNSSEILGTLGVLGNANLFFINPNGIFFGKDASLDLRGSFVGSTATGFTFADGSEFSTIDPTAPPLLTLDVEVPVGLVFEGESNGNIVSEGNLIVEKDLTLVGDNLTLEGQLIAGEDLTLQGNDTVTIRDSFETPFIAASGGNLTVQGDEFVDIFTLNHPQSGLFSGGDMVLRSQNDIGSDTHYWSGGSFRIENLQGDIGSFFSLYDPIIYSQGDVDINNYLGTSLHILAGGSVTVSGTIAITGPETGGIGTDFLQEDITLSNGDVVSINGSQESTLDIRAGVDFSETVFPGLSGQGSFDEFFSFNNDNIFGISVPSINESPDLSNTANRADINIGTIVFVDIPDIPSLLAFLATGDASNADLIPGTVLLTNQYQPNSLPGNIQVSANLNNLLSDVGLSSDFEEVAIQTSGGSVTVDSRNNVSLDGVFNTVPLLGNGGDITILGRGNVNTTEAILNSGGLSDSFLTLGGQNGFSISSDIRNLLIGTGIGGAITLEGNGNVTTGFINTSGGELNATSPQGSINTAGGILNTGTSAGEGGKISLISEGITISGVVNSGGNLGGNISLVANQDITIDGLVNAAGSETGGNITLQGNGNINTEAGILNSGGLSQEFINFANDNGFSIPSNLQPLLIGTGTGGAITLEGNDDITTGFISTSGGELSVTSSQGSIEISGGEVNVISGEGTIDTFGGVLNTSNPLGEGGDISLLADQDINLSGLINSGGGPGSNGGDITVTSTNGEINVTSAVLNSGVVNRGTLETIEENGITIPAIPSVSQTGDGGEISLTASGEINMNLGFIDTSGGELVGKGGLVSLASDTGILMNNVLINSDTFVGESEGLTVETPVLSLENSAIILSVPRESTGISGEIQVDATEIFLNNSTIATQKRGISPGGDITINSDRLTLSEGGIISVGTDSAFDTGTAGTLTVNAKESILISGIADNGVIPSALASTTFSPSDGGDIVVTTPQLTIEGGGVISAATSGSGSGSGGNITINSTVVEITGTSENGLIPSIIFVDTLLEGSGTAGSLTITTDQLIARDGGGISASTFNDSQGGDITINANSIDLRGTSVDTLIESGIYAQSFAGGNAGSLDLSADEITLDDNARITVSSDPESQDTQNFITIGNTILGLLSQINPTISSTLVIEEELRDGNAGDIEIEANTIVLNNQGRITAETFSGNGGSIIIITDTLDLSQGTISTEVQPNAMSDEPSTIDITATTLTLTDDSQISSSTLGNANAGTIIIQDFESANLNNSTISSATLAGAEGNAGTVTLTGDAIAIGNASQILTSVAEGAMGNAGDITLNAPTITLNNNSQVSSSTVGEGFAGTINIIATNFTATTASQLRTTTSTGFNAGNIIFTVSDDLILTGERTGLFASTEEDSTGDGGSIFIDPDTVQVFDGATISVDSQGQGIGGDINLIANTLSLNDGTISAVTLSNTGGNLTLTLQDFLDLRNGSQISTTAGNEQFGGDGGNITIAVPFIVAVPVENSDITANAFLGNGGQVNVDAQALFGIAFRPNLTPLSDITASSTFGLDGEVNINTPGIDPTRGLQQLPQDQVRTDVDQGCQIRGGGNTSFYSVGLRGSPVSPDDLFVADIILEDWIPLNGDSENSFHPTHEAIANISSIPVHNSPISLSCGKD